MKKRRPPAPQEEFVRVAGRPVLVEVEWAVRPEKVDHVWIDIDAGTRLRLAVNTLSRRNRDAGFDERVRVGRVRAVWEELPAPGVFPCPWFDYADVEAAHNVFYELFDKSAMEELLCTGARAAVCIEAWGERYVRKHVGVHQIHSRRASCAVPASLTGRDGALRLYFGDRTSELLLFKFCGQA